jgi:hypothetical protein
MIDNCLDGVFALGIGVPKQEGADMLELVHSLSDPGQIHGEDRGRLVHFGSLNSKVNCHKEGETPIQEAGGGPVVPHDGEPSDPVSLSRLGGEVEMGFPAEPANEPLFDLR